MAHRSEGLSLSPVELAAPMSEQTPITAGHGLDLLGPVVIEGSPEALQTDAMPAPSLSQIDSDTAAETDEQTEMLNTTMVPTPAMHLAADTTHSASSVCGAGAAGTGPPPSELGAAPTPVTSADLSSIDPHYRDQASSYSSDPSLDAMKAHPMVFRSLMCTAPVLSADVIESSFVPQLSPVGSNRRMTENMVYEWWLNMLLDIEVE